MIVVFDPFDLPASLRMLPKARKLASDIGCSIEAIMFEGEPICTQGISKIYMFQSNKLPNHVTVKYAEAVCRILRKSKPEIVIFPATHFCRSLAPRVAAKMECGLTADCIDFAVEEGELMQIVPAFSGSALATIASKNGKFQMVTFSSNNKIEELDYALPEIETFKVSLGIPEITECSNNIINSTHINCTHINSININGMSDAPVMLSGGYGIGSRKNFERLQLLAEKMGVSVGATLAAVNAGFAPHELLVGQTGMSVSPKLYVAFGISGHLQHTIGIAETATIVSVNTDSDSRMSLMADYAVIADAAETVEKLLMRYE